MVFPVIGGVGMGGTQLRNLIAAGDKETFISKLPEHLNDKEKESVWKIASTPARGRALRPGLDSNESLDRLIDDAIDEMNTVSSGAVEIGVGPFGSGKTNKYNPYRKTKKPRVRRPKRQRRR